MPRNWPHLLFVGLLVGIVLALAAATYALKRPHDTGLQKVMGMTAMTMVADARY